jgi:nucleoid-associated protein YgaU
VEHKAQPAVEKPTQDIVAHRGVDSESGAENSTISKQPAKAEESIKSEDRRELEAKQSKMVTEVIKRLKEKKEKDSAKALVQKPKAKRDKVAVTKKVKKREVVRRVPKLKRQTKTKYRVVTIRKGDTLASLAEKYYGNPMYYKPIIRANRDIRSSRSRLRIGQKVIIPTLDKSKKGRRLVRVRKGDTLASIAKRYYGNPNKYQKIIDANYKIKNKHTRLHIGQLIYVP